MRGINSPLLKCTDLALLISVAVTTNGICSSSKVFTFKNLRKPFSMPFMDIIRELAPDATSQVETITGARTE